MLCRSALAIATLFVCPLVGLGAVVTIDFEGVADSTAADLLYTAQGVTFSSGVVVVAGGFGGSLNEIDYPPRAPGQAVFLNDSNTTTLQFSQAILSFSGFFTYGGPLTLNFYDGTNSLLTTLTSGFSTNVATAGDPGSAPNEELAVAALSNAIRVEILAPSVDFTLDDLTFETVGTGVVPEPGSVVLVLTGTGALAALARRRVRGKEGRL